MTFNFQLYIRISSEAAAVVVCTWNRDRLMSESRKIRNEIIHINIIKVKIPFIIERTASRWLAAFLHLIQLSFCIRSLSIHFSHCANLSHWSTNEQKINKLIKTRWKAFQLSQFSLTLNLALWHGAQQTHNNKKFAFFSELSHDYLQPPIWNSHQKLSEFFHCSPSRESEKQQNKAVLWTKRTMEKLLKMKNPIKTRTNNCCPPHRSS